MISSQEVLREAWRNTKAGASRPIFTLIAFFLLIGGLGSAQAFWIAQVNRDADHWRSVGAAIQVVTMPGKIDGATCDELARVSGVAAAGAVRNGPSLQFAALPSTTFATFEGTPGLSKVLGVNAPPDAPKIGVWISSDLASTLGVSGQATRALRTTAGQSILVAGQYAYAEDGRLPILAYNLVSEVPAAGAFDACWVEIWPENPELDALLTLPVEGSKTSGQADAPKIQQLNASEGTVFAGKQRLERLPNWLPLSASVTIGILLGFILIWSRRLEIASALHAGISKIALMLQVAAELMIATTSAAALSLAAGLTISSTSNPGAPLPALLACASVVATGLTSTIVGAVLMTFAISENRLFRYFKSR